MHENLAELRARYLPPDGQHVHGDESAAKGDPTAWLATTYPTAPIAITHIAAGRGGIMCHSSKRGMAAASSCLLRGVAFEIADLALIKRWADLRNIGLVIRLDHGTVGEEYEEVIAFYPEMSRTCRVIMWRTAGAVFVQPLIGRKRRYGSVAKALASLTWMPGTILTEITVPTTY